MNTDLAFLKEIKDNYHSFDAYCNQELGSISVEYPLDADIRNMLDAISLRDDDEDLEVFRFFNDLITLWEKLIGKSINNTLLIIT